MCRNVRRDYSKLEETLEDFNNSKSEAINTLRSNIENAKVTMKSAVELNREIYGHVNDKLEHVTIKSDELVANMTLISKKHRELRDNTAERFRQHNAKFAEISNTADKMNTRFTGLEDGVEKAVNSLTEKITDNSVRLMESNKKIGTNDRELALLQSRLTDTEATFKEDLKSMTSKEKLTAVMKIFDAKLETDKAALRALESELEEEIESLKAGIEKSGKQIELAHEKRRQLEMHFNQAMAFEKQNSIKQISIVEKRLSDPIRGVQRKLDSFEQLVMSELNKNDESDADLKQKIKAINATILSDGKTLAETKNAVTSIKRITASKHKQLEGSIDALVYQIQLHEDMLANLEGLDKSQVSDSMEKHSKLADTVIQEEFKTKEFLLKKL